MSFFGLNRKIFNTKLGDIVYWTNEIKSEYALVFLHGLTADHRLFSRNLSPFLDKIKILVWDAPSHGESRPYREFDYDDGAEMLKKILDRENIFSPVFVGQSMGGFITQIFMDKYREVAKGFVRVDSCPFGKKYYSKRDYLRLKSVAPLCAILPYSVLVKASSALNARQRERQENMEIMLSDLTKEEYCYLADRGFGTLPRVMRDVNITCPTVIIVGERDRTGKVKVYSERWHKDTGFPLYTIPGAAHNSNRDKPAIVNRHIRNLLKKIEKG